MAVLESITTDDIRTILRAIVKRAGEGDLQAARLILSYAVGNPATVERGGPASEPAPTEVRPGSRQKIEILARRYANGQELHAPGDNHLGRDE
jgi:hypothetical protein